MLVKKTNAFNTLKLISAFNVPTAANLPNCSKTGQYLLNNLRMKNAHGAKTVNPIIEAKKSGGEICIPMFFNGINIKTPTTNPILITNR